MYTKISLPVYGKGDTLLIGNSTLELVSKELSISTSKLISIAEKKVTEFLINMEELLVTEDKIIKVTGKSGTLLIKLFNGINQYKVSFEFRKGVI